jgi:DNA-binding CsgD family transcriptional regulator
MDRAVAWTAGTLAIVNAGLALSVVWPVHRARVAARSEKSTLGSRIGLVFEAGLLVYALGAMLRGAFAIAAATGAEGAGAVIMDWGLISVSATLLVVFLAMRRDLLPIMRSLRRSERALTVALGAFTPETLNPRNLDLSIREQEVLALIAAGKVSDQEIAEDLFISTATAGTHVRNILKKAGLHDRRQLVLIGLREPDD